MSVELCDLFYFRIAHTRNVCNVTVSKLQLVNRSTLTWFVYFDGTFLSPAK
jgi:hypothetical protein